MSTYLSRPVFDFPINWAENPSRGFSYDLRDKTIAFAAPAFEQLQTATVQAYEFDVLLETESKIKAFDEFVELVGGRMKGFWFPAAFSSMEITAGGTSEITIRDEGLANWFNDHPCTYLAFSKPGETMQFAKIGTVVAVDGGKEIVTLTSALSDSVYESWSVCRLLYVRFSDDEEEAEYIADNLQQRTVKVLEMPTEYAEIETGLQPVYLYEFTQTLGVTTQTWRLTGLNESITSSGNAFTSFPIKHNGWRRSTKQDREEMTIESWYDLAKNPISLFVPFKVPTSLWVKVMETTYTAPNTRTTIFAGKVLEVEPEGKLMKARCASWLDVAGRQCPKFLLQPMCNYAVYDTHCGILKNAFTVNGSFAAIHGRRLTIDVASNPPISGKTASRNMNYFALGWLETGTGANYEIRSIRQNAAYSDGQIIVRIDRPLDHASQGQSCKLIAGCDGSATTCRDKFFNFKRWGGHVMAPANASMEPIDSQMGAGGKKG